MALHLLGMAGSHLLKRHLNDGYYCNGGYGYPYYPAAMVQHPQPTVDVQIPNNPNQGGPRVRVGYEYPKVQEQQKEERKQKEGRKTFWHYLFPCLPIKYRRLSEEED